MRVNRDKTRVRCIDDAVTARKSACRQLIRPYGHLRVYLLKPGVYIQIYFYFLIPRLGIPRLALGSRFVHLKVTTLSLSEVSTTLLGEMFLGFASGIPLTVKLVGRPTFDDE